MDGFLEHMERRAGCWDEPPRGERDEDFEYDNAVDRDLEEE